jgi:hypothetical protein
MQRDPRKGGVQHQAIYISQSLSSPQMLNKPVPI